MAKEESKSGLKGVGEGLKSILERIADFFDIFDLSFLVSGVTSAGAIAFWTWKAQIDTPSIPKGWIGGVGLVIGGYVMGLVCFAMGRWIRRGWRKRRAESGFFEDFVKVLKGHGLSETPPFSTYLERKELSGDWCLYVRLWAELRDALQLKSSYSLLRRYWVMAATYDGLAVALICWFFAVLVCVFGIGGAQAIDPWFGVPAMIGLVVAAAACSREGGRYERYQVEELVATIAAARKVDDR